MQQLGSLCSGMIGEHQLEIGRGLLGQLRGINEHLAARQRGAEAGRLPERSSEVSKPSANASSNTAIAQR